LKTNYLFSGVTFIVGIYFTNLLEDLFSVKFLLLVIGGLLAALWWNFYEIRAKFNKQSKQLAELQEQLWAERETDSRPRVQIFTPPVAVKTEDDVEIRLRRAEEKLKSQPPPLPKSIDPLPSPIHSTNESGYVAKHTGEVARVAKAAQDIDVKAELDIPTLPLFKKSSPLGHKDTAQEPEEDSWHKNSPDPGLPAWVQSWFNLENWPIKVGVLLLLIGLGSALKYLLAQGYISVSIELRLLGVAAICIAVVIFGLRSAKKRREFGLSMQGGGLGGLLLTLYASLQLYHVLPSLYAFIGMVVTVAVGVGLAVRQDALWLAVFAQIGGFAAPILCSTGSGAYQQLFSYYLVLNFGILAIALWKGWRALNVIGAIATFGIGITWGVTYYRPEYFKSVEPFLLAFFAMYLVITILYVLKHKENRKSILDGALIFGVPLATINAQAGLLQNSTKLGISAFIGSLIYGLLSYILLRIDRAELLRQSFLMIAVTLFTLSIPLYFSAQVTCALWAIEGAGILWLGLKQNRFIPQLFGQLLQIGAAISYSYGFENALSTPAFFNAREMGALSLAIGALMSGFLFDRAQKSILASFNLIWGVLCWIGLGFLHVIQFVPSQYQWSILIGFMGMSTALYAVMSGVMRWPRIAWVSVLGSACLPIIALVCFVCKDGMWDQGRGLAVIMLVAGAFLSLFLLRNRWHWGLSLAHSALLCGFVLCLILSMLDRLQTYERQDGVVIALIAFPLAAFAALLLSRWNTFTWPAQAHFPEYRFILTVMVIMTLIVLGLVASNLPGYTGGLTYIPFLNPLELSLATISLCFWYWYQRYRDEFSAEPKIIARVVMLCFFWFITTATLRFTLHMLEPKLALAGRGLGAAFMARSGQACLAIVWSVLGCGAMIMGHRRHARTQWITGAILMGIVLVKLMLIDRHNLRDVTGITAMIAVGGLLATVGYFAPMPPVGSGRLRLDQASEDEENLDET
jgi:uncharacterized membrane protein